MYVRTSLLCIGLALTACGSDEPSTGADAGPGAADSGTANRFSTSSKILAYLDGRTLTMTGANIPSHPNGFNEDANLGQATQCYHSTVMQVSAGGFNITSELGTLEGAPNVNDVGTCNHDTVAGAPAMFASTAVLIENVQGNGECFDFNITFAGFAQEGRGKINADGTTLVLELFFKDQAVGHRCAAGAVGAQTVTLNTLPFTGNAQQTYTISQ